MSILTYHVTYVTLLSNVTLQLTADAKEYGARFARCHSYYGPAAAELWR